MTDAGTRPAAVAVLPTADAGDTAHAAAMSVVIIAIGLAGFLDWALMRGVNRHPGSAPGDGRVRRYA